ncbi:MAG: YaiI/YqxD family protein [Mariprofundaceae bacterium]|nr:YaiI/YqxD family protein [Mariprofundaceae bacterium]
MLKKNHLLHIWVDADACPVAIKEVLFRAAERTQIMTTLVANSALRIPKSPYIQMLQVGAGFDVADHKIISLLKAEDLVITSDIPLADEVLEHHAHALSPRGELFSSDTIKSRLNMRDFLETLRASGIHSDTTAAFKATDKQAFSNQLDRFLTRYLKNNS